jgi:mannose-6-phosphate isomerase
MQGAAERSGPPAGKSTNVHATMQRLTNTVMAYPWGSTQDLAALRGLPPSEKPEAELWMGAHPNAPSSLDDGRPLDAAIASGPVEFLGTAIAAEFGRLPFLLKLLAAAEPLSLQAHPSKAQAEAGFAHEEALGIPRAAPHRNYKDNNHKPELVCALTPFWALCGFREPAESAALLRALEVDALAPIVALLDAGNLREAFLTLLGVTGEARAALVRPAVAAAKARRPTAKTDPYFWLARLGDAYPDDAGAITSLLLNLLELKPNQALYLPAGNLHAYLEGFAVEIMAASDNVLRGGLTPKYVDREELAKVLDIAPYAVVVFEPAIGTDHFAHYRTPARDFALARYEAGGETAASGPIHGPAIVVAVGPGTTVATDGAPPVTLAPSEALFVAADAPPVTLQGGTAFVATVGQGELAL